MADVLINDKHLHDIADAIRGKVGGELITQTKVSKTQNATGFDGFDGNYGVINKTIVDVVRIEGASSIHVKMAYQTINRTYGYVQVASGEYTADNFPTGADKYGGSTITTVELDFSNTDVITIAFTDRNAASTNYLGYYAEVSGDVLVKNTYKPREMASAIENIEARDENCTGMHIPESALFVTGNCQQKFFNNSWNWFIEQGGSKIVTEGITNANQMFSYSTELEEIPFDINLSNSTYCNVNSMFSTCYALKKIGTINDFYPEKMDSMFRGCRNLRYLPNITNPNFSRIYAYANTSMTSIFDGCYSLRSIPEEFLKQIYMPATTAYYYVHFYCGFGSCYSLDEIRGLNPITGALASNAFSISFSNCGRLKELVFAVQEDGTPYQCNWKSQTIDLSSTIGYVGNPAFITNYNSGITEATRITDADTYEQFKNHPDSWTTDVAYSRYNKQSAINTINSLPDTSAYLATAGGTNTIKFKGAAGSATDEGAIQDLDAETIALAASKGWTVSFT